ncbi:hypothetical protein FACS189485_17730 [Spirochaetia bacterium]|nr:hypothetical protein FACS189485_17730 [Spirochaetia bacterium]
MLYNGTEPYDDEKILRLSDSFKDAALEPGSGTASDLELTVRIYNINHGRNEPLLQRYRTLNWYSAFIAKVREYEKTAPDRETAMKMAIKYCIEHDILKEFLKQHSTEVMNMLLTEWNWDTALKARGEEAREEGREEGENRILELMTQGYSVEQIKAKLAARTAETKTAGK